VVGGEAALGFMLVRGLYARLFCRQRLTEARSGWIEEVQADKRELFLRQDRHKRGEIQVSPYLYRTHRVSNPSRAVETPP
jgi:hypothetical protein